jgi:hypothetical protein
MVVAIRKKFASCLVNALRWNFVPMAEAIHYLETAAFIRDCAAAIQNKFSGASRPASALFHQMQESKDLYNAAAWSYRGTVIGAVQNVADALRALQRCRRAQDPVRFRTCVVNARS